jgi:hypothetical protein
MFRPKDAAEGDRIFSALAVDGTVQIPIGEACWALLEKPLMYGQANGCGCQ